MGDEKSPCIHVTYIPYTNNSSKEAPRLGGNTEGGASGDDVKRVWLGAFLQRLQSKRKSYLVGLPQGKGGRDGEGRADGGDTGVLG